MEKNGRKIPLPSSTPARSLLAFLLFNHPTPQTRATLTGLFWPELSETRARRALSQSLWQIRRVLPELLTVAAESISVSPIASIHVDATSFEQTANHAGRDEAGLRDLEQAIGLVHGDFLEGDYHDWALLERERLRELFLQTLEQLEQLEKQAGRFTKALELATRLCRTEPLNESAHREIMRLHQLLGQPEAALRQFETCRQTLHQELDVEPEPETLALAEEIRRRAGGGTPGAAKEKEGLVPTPLIGREADRAALIPFVEGIFNKLGGLVLIEGEAGIGKTRLLQEIAREAEWRGAQVLWGNANEAQGDKPFAPFAEALQAGLSPLRAAQIQQMVKTVWLQAILPLLAPQTLWPMLAPAPSLPSAQEQERLVEAIIHILAGWAGIVPLIVLLEDLHWADSDTLELLPTLARRLGSAGILIIGSYRGEEARARPQVWEALQAVSRANLLERRALSRLDEAATGELIRRSLGLASPAPLFEERLYRETDGNPLFLLETLRALQDENLLSRDENGRWNTPWDESTADYQELPLPPLVEQVITKRLERLPNFLRRPLNTMAALGIQFNFAELITASGMEIPVALDTMRELIRRAFLKETPNGYRFEHDKIHRVVYAGIKASKRAGLHRSIATRLEAVQATDPDTLAYHFWRAQAWKKAAHYNRLAGENALRIHANREAATHFSRALESLGRLPHTNDRERASLLQARETANGLLGDRSAQRNDLDELDRLLSDPADRAELALRFAKYHEALSDYPSAIESAQRAIDSASQTRCTEIVIAGHFVQARAHTMQAQLEPARQLLAEALDLACMAEDRFQEARCLYLIGSIFYEQSRFDETVAYCQQALQIFQSLGDQENEANCLILMGNARSDLGETSIAIKTNEQVLQIRRALGDRRGEAQAQYSLAIRCHFAGDDETALCYCRAMTATAQAIGDLRLEAYGQTYIGLLLEKDDPQQAYQHYARSLEIRQQIGQPAMQVDSRAGLARALLEMGRVAEAVAQITTALEWVNENGTDCVGDMWLVYLAGYRIYSASGRDDDAALCIETAHDYLIEEMESLPDKTARSTLLKNLPELREVDEIYREFQKRHFGTQRVFQLPCASQPDKQIPATLTLKVPEDDEIKGKVEKRQHRLRRILKEAEGQGCAPTHEHLAEALGVSLRTVERDMAELKKDTLTR